jgi:son of sevenless-like protein
MPQKPRRPTTAPGASTGIPENEELSPLGIPSIDRGFMGNAPDLRHRQNSVASLNSSLNHPYSNPAYSIDFDHPSISPQRVHPRSASLSGAPTLSVPHLSTSLPARPGGSYFPAERAASHDSNFSLPARSVLSSDSSAHLSGPVREAVTDPRIIVNVNETGVVQSGTLEGLVERLIVNFSGCRWPPTSELNLTYMHRPTARYRIQRRPPHSLCGFYDSRRLLRDAIPSFLRSRVKTRSASRRQGRCTIQVC